MLKNINEHCNKKICVNQTTQCSKAKAIHVKFFCTSTSSLIRSYPTNAQSLHWFPDLRAQHLYPNNHQQLYVPKNPLVYSMDDMSIIQMCERARATKSFPCPNCSSVYNRRSNLTQHLKYVCFQKPRFACPHCSYVSKRTFSVYGHVRSKHPNDKVGYIDIENPGQVIEPQTQNYSRDVEPESESAA